GNNAVELVVLSRDNNGYVTPAPTSLKNNMKNYLSKYRMLTDTVDILDGEVINIAINFSILTESGFGNKAEIVNNCMLALKDYFNVEKWQIGQPINLTDVYILLGNVSGVYSVYDFTVQNRAGTLDSRSYSEKRFNVAESTKNG